MITKLSEKKQSTVISKYWRIQNTLMKEIYLIRGRQEPNKSSTCDTEMRTELYGPVIEVLPATKGINISVY